MSTSNPVMIFNPEAPRGSDIAGEFGGVNVSLPAGQLLTFPYPCAMALLNRYPWLHEVVDSPIPGAAPDTLPPSGVVGETEAPVETEAPAEEPTPEVAVGDFACDECPKTYKKETGLAKHKATVHAAA